MNSNAQKKLDAIRTTAKQHVDDLHALYVVSREAAERVREEHGAGSDKLKLALDAELANYGLYLGAFKLARKLGLL
jgi:hypothetical protein